MKKFLCAFLALVTLFGATLSASCGGGGGENSVASSSSSSSETVDMSKVVLKYKTKTYDIENGQSVAMDVQFTIDGEDGDKAELSFSSNAPEVATVSADGTVTGVSGGKAYITVAYGTKSVRAQVNVTMRENRLLLSEDSWSMLVGDTKQVTAQVFFGLTELTDAVPTWQSSDPTVATVENGVITAVGGGSATITATYEDASATVALTVVPLATTEQVNTFNEEYINVYGRTYKTSGKLNLDHAASGVEFGFIGTTCSVKIYSSAKSKMRVFIDGSLSGEKINVDTGTREYVLASNLTDGCHTVRFVKGSEELFAKWEVVSLIADKFYVIPEKSELKIEFIGDSLTTGYGLYGSAGQEATMDNSDSTKSYAYLTAHALGADYSIVGWTGICTTVTDFWAGEYSMEKLYEWVSGSNRARYAFDFEADVVVLNLGTNESSYLTRPDAGGDSTYAQYFEGDYQRFLETIREKNPNAYIICLYGMIHQNNMISVGIQSAIDKLDDDKIIYNPFTIEADTHGAMNHPNSVAHKAWGDALAAYIRTLFA